MAPSATLLPSTQQYVAYYGGSSAKQRGRGGDQFGHIYTGSRFSAAQRGRGLGSVIGSVVRGISGLITRSPGWLKTGAKIAGKSALRALSDYGDDVRAGVTPTEARKRALKSAFGEALEEGAKRMRGSGAVKKGKKQQRGAGRPQKKTKKKKCCRLRLIGRGSKRKQQQQKKKPVKKAIKGRSKFNLLSV